MNVEISNKRHPQVKICGLTSVDAAVKCAELGANAIGCNFYPKSPRYISRELARDIATALPPSVRSVGVFVNNTYDEVMKIVDDCQLTGVQLHGRESPEMVQRLSDNGIKVYKVLYMVDDPGLSTAKDYSAAAFLVEHGKGVMPGGNAQSWEWGQIAQFGGKFPLILSGGLAPENIQQAITSSEPDAVDVSSGVESAPGIKDVGKVAAFLTGVFETQRLTRLPRIIF